MYSYTINRILYKIFVERYDLSSSKSGKSEDKSKTFLVSSNFISGEMLTSKKKNTFFI